MAEQLTVEALKTAINELRKDPKTLIPALQKRIGSYEGHKYRDTTGAKYKSMEGDAPAKEVLDILEKSTPLVEFIVDDALSNCAQTHADYLCTSGNIGHLDQDGLTVGKRLDKLGTWSGKLNEVIAVQSLTAEDVLVKWLIDDGIPDRGDRQALLSTDFKKIGVGVNLSHTTHKSCIVVLFVESFGVNGSADVPQPEENSNIVEELPENLKNFPEGTKSVTVVKRTVKDGDKDKIEYFVKYNMLDGSVQEAAGGAVPFEEAINSKPKAIARVVPVKDWPKAYEPPLPFLEQTRKQEGIFKPAPAQGSALEKSILGGAQMQAAA